MRKIGFYLIALSLCASLFLQTAYASESADKAEKNATSAAKPTSDTKTISPAANIANTSAVSPLAAESVAKPATNKPDAAIVGLLSNVLSDIKSTGTTRTLLPNDQSLTDREIFAEYGTKAITERNYGRFLVRIYTTEYPVQAYGLYSFYRDPVATTTDFGSEGDLDVVEGFVQFWQGNRYIEVKDQEQAHRDAASLLKLAKAVSVGISALDTKAMPAEDIETAKQLPSIVRHLPNGSLNLRTARYILGPLAFARLTKHDPKEIEFYPEFGTEIALASYDQSTDKSWLLIIEYHTPQQASAALTRLTQYHDQLPATDQAKTIVKRQGNYIVEAYNFAEKSLAERTVNDVKYDYVVKWLDDDSAAAAASERNFASEAAKTGKLLTSVFGLIGITLITALIMGVSFGMAKFYMRRRNTRNLQTFSDAGGMMRLNLDGIDGIGLPEGKKDQKLIDSGN